jgi:hypothetical protein
MSPTTRAASPRMTAAAPAAAPPDSPAPPPAGQPARPSRCWP